MRGSSHEIGRMRGRIDHKECARHEDRSLRHFGLLEGMQHINSNRSSLHGQCLSAVLSDYLILASQLKAKWHIKNGC